jgi:hypothetical protein
MNRQRDFDEIARHWLDDGTDSTPPHVIDAVLLATRSTPQERDLRVSWRNLSMKNPVYAAAAVAVVAVAAVAALYSFGPGANFGSGPTPSPSVQETQVPTATQVESHVNLPSGWTAYTSAQYGFTIGHPADWSVQPAERAWSFAADADDVLSMGQEMFISPDGHVRVSAWPAPVDPGRSFWVESQTQSWANVAEWIEEYCEASGNAPCGGISDRAVPLCLERRDCHPGLLVHFQEDVQAFFTQGGEGAEMMVVAVWWAESAPAVEPYGGSQQLLEAFLSTMCVWPEDGRPPFDEPVPGC